MRSIWLRLKHILLIIGNFQARVLLTIFYALLVVPLGIGMRLFLDPLRARLTPDARSYWLPRERSTPDRSTPDPDLLAKAREQG